MFYSVERAFFSGACVRHACSCCGGSGVLIEKAVAGMETGRIEGCDGIVRYILVVQKANKFDGTIPAGSAGRPGAGLVSWFNMTECNKPDITLGLIDAERFVSVSACQTFP